MSRRSRYRAPVPAPTYTYQAPTYDRCAAEADTLRFATLSECVERAMKSPTWGDSESTGFMGGTWAETKQYSTLGWPDGVREATEKANRVVDRAVQSTAALVLNMELSYDVAGAAYDVGGYLSGVPECWMRPQLVIERKAISIITNIVASASVPASALRTRGIAVASLVLALQAQGYPVTLDVCENMSMSYRSGKTVAHVVRVLDASTGSQMDLDRVVYAIAHPTMFRGVFRAVMGDNDWGPCCPESEGYPPGEYDLKFGGAHLNEAMRWTDGGEAWVLETFEKQTLG